MPTVLIVEDDEASRVALETALLDCKMEVTLAASAEEAVARLKLAPVDVIVTDVVMGRMDGMDLLRHVQQQCPDTAVILVTGHATVAAAVDAMREGAYDYLPKPVDLDRLELVVERACRKQSLVRENRELRSALKGQFSAGEVIGQSQAMRGVLQQVEQVAPTNATVLILGESGTGKELIATAIHAYSQRSQEPLVKVNCAALPEGLVESELFGHERGAFTGAHRTRRGRFELANHGTLFLDEVGDLTLATQIKLLRVLQERELERVGGQRTIPVDVRLIAATNQDLEQSLKDGHFREELYYRLKVVTIDVPPLRSRRDDIVPLLNYFLAHYVREHNRSISAFTQRAVESLCEYDWPGNVRELRNLVESLVVTTRGDEIDHKDLPASLVGRSPAPQFSSPMGKSLEAVERAYIMQTLRMLQGNKTKAAQVLGIGKKTLYRRLEAYGVVQPLSKVDGENDGEHDGDGESEE
ncbi:MAG: sigma-54-dependent Fis family transcriptional regulator [Deltaproteobacteria bacterium]|nr:sigma-54-dependent Fis family transcriptional regulator [Deltaproteobacteria bacterium]